MTEIELRILGSTDADTIYKVIDVNRSRLREWLNWLDQTKSAKDLENFITDGEKAFSNKEMFRYGIFYNNKFVGIIELKTIDYKNRKSIIGYWLAAEYEGKGVMSQAMSAILKLAFEELKLNKVELHIATKNVKNNNIAHRFEFKQDGISRDSEWLYDHFVDHNIYSLLKREWEDQE